MSDTICWKVGAAFVTCVLSSIVALGQTFTTLADFGGWNGSLPAYEALIQGSDGNFYGTAQQGGLNDYGVVFRTTPNGGLVAAYNFCTQSSCTDGAYPAAGVILASDGNAYGTTYDGGTYGYGTVFRLSPARILTVLYSFNSSDGAYPQGGLRQGIDGNFYGTTNFGGTNGYGTVFKITLNGTLTTLHRFSGSDGSAPFRALVQLADGNFYGVTEGGGSNKGGTVFKITPAGTLTTLYNFCTLANCADGASPNELAQGSDGNLYGTTSDGGNSQCQFGCGTVFKITPAGVLMTLYSFCDQTNCADGEFPYAALVQATDGRFYGTTYEGGAGPGTIFSITPDGQFAVLHNFCMVANCVDGSYPAAPLLQATDGKLYGSTFQGGTDPCSNGGGCGTIFSLDMGLGPFVAFVRNPTKAGQMFGILGQGFTGTTNVSLNGTSISFTVKSDTLITATIPAGGTTGPVTVTTPTGTLTSNVPFRVLPQLLSFTPTSGPVGTQVTITGVSLTQTSGVGFGDYNPAQFTVNSDTQVTATVPSGAKTGPVGIQTQGGIAISPQTFTVTQ